MEMSADMEKDIQDKRSRLQRFVGRGPEESSSRGVNHIAIFALDLEATAERRNPQRAVSPF